ncbi:MAG: aldehyde dehydrogenase family protein, partial [Pseudomonadota bacterium]
MAVNSPIDGRDFATITAGTADDVDHAVAAARAAFEDRRWAGMAPAARGAVLTRLADLITAEALSLAVLGVRDNGTEISMALRAEPGSAAATFRWYGGAIDKIYGEIAPTAGSHLGLIHREPVGVIGAIVPWNFPLMIGAWKLAPALAAGNSVVLKPAETASLSLLRLAELASEAGLPDGVLNVVTGDAPAIGGVLTSHPAVQVLTFTGSTPVGKLLAEQCGRHVKKTSLELGGNAPFIVFDDADLDDAVEEVIASKFRNSGQTCVCANRIFVQSGV